MPIIEGYDEQELGPSKFKAGEHQVTITSAKFVEGTTKAGFPYIALDVGLQGDGAFENQRIFLPRTTEEWQEWEDWKRKNCKQALVGIGIDMAEVEDETARENLIGKTITIKVVEHKGNLYINFQRDSGKDTASLPLPQPVSTPTASPIVI